MAPFQAGQFKDYFTVDTPRSGACFIEWGGPVFWNGRIVGVVPYAASQPCGTRTSAYSLNNPRAMDFVYGAIEDPAGLKSRHDFR
jgi:hypothetical protein